MDNLVLVIGNKNYSSWSMRPWLVLRHFEIPFEEIRVPLYREDSKEALNRLSPSGLVPALIHGKLTIWDSLAICEYVQELFPSLAMWPRERQARAVARSIACEMHSGFAGVRTHMPMNCRKSFPGRGRNQETESEIQRIQQIWRECRLRYGGDGAMLFGEFSVADAMFAPVAIRFNTYKVDLADICSTYAAAVLALPGLQQWVSAARRESEVLPAFEPYEST